MLKVCPGDLRAHVSECLNTAAPIMNFGIVIGAVGIGWILKMRLGGLPIYTSN